MIKQSYYPRGINLTSSQNLRRKISNFWRSVLDIGKYVILFSTVQIGNRVYTSFWHNCWITDSNLKITFSVLYWLAEDKDCTVAAFMSNKNWSQNFINLSHPVAQTDLPNLSMMLRIVDHLNHIDRRLWRQFPNYKFSMSTCYKFLIHGEKISSFGLII